jgi:hypothetical protein
LLICSAEEQEAGSRLAQRLLIKSSRLCEQLINHHDKPPLP